MRFRTEVEPLRSDLRFDHNRPVVMLGSCFTDNIGARLAADGFDVTANPFGALYNPMSIAVPLLRVLDRRPYTAADLTPGPRGFHCLDYSTAFSSDKAEEVITKANNSLEILQRAIAKPGATLIATFGTAYIFSFASDGRIVGNCHKFPASSFIRRRLGINEITECRQQLATRLRAESGINRILLTISPIRHLANGLHGNTISKATLHLAVDALAGCCDYFPAFEIMNDDLRDYRFYAADMKHPSETAVDYIYERFSEAYFDRNTLAEAMACRARSRHEAHRPILEP